MIRNGLRLWVVVCVVVGTLCVLRAHSHAIPLDKNDEIKLGVRAYVNARVGTESTHDGVPIPARRPITSTSGTFPHSAAGHLRQNRGFIEAELHHDLRRLQREGIGPLSLLNDLPFKIRGLAYHVTFRGEGEGLYDWGPREYSTADEFEKVRAAASTVARGQVAVDVASNRRRLRKLGTDRERLYQAYVEASVGDLFVRFGRQILSWGETDGFRLLDNINPLDSSFGGFLISLDERRVPLDMGRVQYRIGSLGPLSEIFLEGYVAIDNKVGFYPGTPAGSPWALPSLGAPSNLTRSFAFRPARNFDNARGGARLVFNAADATFSIAHYYTYVDTPSLQVFTSGPDGNSTVSVAFDDGLICPPTADPSLQPNHCGFPTHAYQTAPKVQVSGATTTFAIPQLYTIVRSEVAYFKDEPAFSQGQLDPFIFNQPNVGSRNTGGRRLRDSIACVLGLDVNQWLRFLNPHQTFFFSTQFFYKHIKNAHGDTPFVTAGPLAGTPNPDREVLPITLNILNIPGRTLGRNEPLFIQQPRDQFLQTLFITTSYRSGTINPGFLMFYDWGGGLVYQPSVSFTREPFRFAIDYSILDSHIYKGGSGVSLLKDRDNVQFRFEYVI